MREFKEMHPFTKALIASFLFLLCIAVAGSLTSCGSIKKVDKSAIKTHEVTKTDSAVVSTKVTETKLYGDTLKGQGFLQPDTVNADSIMVESAGISLKLKLTPQKNTKGAFAGNLLNYTAIAKPIAQTSAKQVDNTIIKKQTKADKASNTQSNTSTKSGFSLPWYCWVIAIGLIVGAGFYLIKCFKII